jgi:hypothetical protein
MMTSYCYRTLSGPQCVMKVKKIAKLEKIVLLHACNFRWAKNSTLSYETGIFRPDIKMLKVHQDAPTSMLKSQNSSGVIPPEPRIERGREGGNRCLAHGGHDVERAEI